MYLQIHKYLTLSMLPRSFKQICIAQYCPMVYQAIQLLISLTGHTLRRLKKSSLLSVPIQEILCKFLRVFLTRNCFCMVVPVVIFQKCITNPSTAGALSLPGTAVPSRPRFDLGDLKIQMWYACSCTYTRLSFRPKTLKGSLNLQGIC